MDSIALASASGAPVPFVLELVDHRVLVLNDLVEVNRLLDRFELSD